MKLYLASDHAGFEAKEALKKITKAETPAGPQTIEWIDLGPVDAASVDYPLFAQKLCEELLSTATKAQLMEPCAVLICGSGVGMSMAANRYAAIRAVLADRLDIAELSRQHNASNVLCMGSRILDRDQMKSIFEKWVSTSFAGDRHTRRVDQLSAAGKM